MPWETKIFAWPALLRHSLCHGGLEPAPQYLWGAPVLLGVGGVHVWERLDILKPPMYRKSFPWFMPVQASLIIGKVYIKNMAILKTFGFRILLHSYKVDLKSFCSCGLCLLCGLWKAPRMREWEGENQITSFWPLDPWGILELSKVPGPHG